MYIVSEDRESIAEAMLAPLARLGFSGMTMRLAEIRDWLATASEKDITAIEGVMVGGGPSRIDSLKEMRKRFDGPIIVVNDQRMLNDTLEFFAAGADDVVTKPVHMREVLARMAAIRRRLQSAQDKCAEPIRVFSDGRDPIVGDVPLQLPRRELRILECLVASRSAWLTKSRIFNSVYGVCDDRFDEDVVESHICRLRKRLKNRLGYDPIETQRFLGYRLKRRDGAVVSSSAPDATSLTQAPFDQLVAQ